MNLRVENGLPIAELEVEFSGVRKILHNVLFDTGCALTIFDTDLMAEIGLIIDFSNGIPRTMFGVGGRGEICIEQKVSRLNIDNKLLKDINIQLGMVEDMYGFDGILGLDYMLKTGMVIDFNLLKVKYRHD